ncbi:RICIN domain-containing protein [Kitasatospora sp. LaBMicrA B282]|uniref:RICIN domain-containing protein n=1 Tax=Kitasatospora sp. LaBMicrA B282 TaxID=3420949 RepID=UPI003D13E7CA
MPLTTRIAAAALGTGLALTNGVPGASADDYHPSGVPNVVTLGSASSPHCLEIADWRRDDGAPARQWSCTGGANQNWSLVGGSLVNVNSGECLEIADWRQDDGAPARQWSCTGGANQKWIWTHIPGTGYTLRNAWSGKCLDVPGGQDTNGVPMQQWDCWNGNNQIWYDFGAGQAWPPVNF